MATQPDRATVRFRNTELRADYVDLVQESGRMLSLSTLIEMAMEIALPEVRKRVKELHRKAGN